MLEKSFKGRLCIIVILFFTLVSFLPQQTHSATPEPDFKVKPLHNGYYRDGNWAGFEIWLKSEVAWRGEVRSTLPFNPQTNYTFSRKVELTAGKEERLLLYVLPTRFEPRFEVGLYDSEGQKLKSHMQPLEMAGKTDYTVGVLADTLDSRLINSFRSGVMGLTQPTTRVIVTLLPSLELIDTPIALESLDAIIVGDINPAKITPDLRRHILAWVQEGGKLWLSVESPLLDQPLYPALITGSYTVPALKGIYLPDTKLKSIETPVQLNRLEVLEGATTAVQADDGTPLVVTRPLGQGSIVLTAFNLLSPTLGEITRTSYAWWYAVSEASQLGTRHPSLRQKWAELTLIPRQFAIQPPTDVPDPLWLWAGLLLYIGLATIGSFALAQKLQQPLVAWLVLPAFALIGGVVIGYTGKQIGVAEVYFSRVGLVNFNSAYTPASVKSVVVGQVATDQTIAFGLRNDFVYRPQSNTLNIQPFQIIPPGLFEQKSSVTPQSSNLSPNLLMVFGGQGVYDGQLELATNFNISANTREITGMVRNQSRWDLSNVTLIFGDNYLEIGDLAQGEERQVKMSVTNLPNFLPRLSIEPTLYGSSLASLEKTQSPLNLTQWANNMRWSVLNTAYLNGRFAPINQTNQLFLTAWLEGQTATEILGAVQTPPDLKIRRQDLAMFIKPLALSYQNNNDIFVPASALNPVRIFAANVTPANDSAINIGDNGSAVFQFQLPVLPLNQPQTLEISIRASKDTFAGRQALPQIQIWNWQQNDWENIGLQGDNRKLIHLNAKLDQYIGRTNGYIRIRASTIGENYILENLNLELTAKT